jgi:hypothetical protein
MDDLVVVFLGLALALRLVPPDVMDECRKQAAETFAAGRPVSRRAAVVVILVWILVAALVGTFIAGLVRR